MVPIKGPLHRIGSILGIYMKNIHFFEKKSEVLGMRNRIKNRLPLGICAAAIAAAGAFIVWHAPFKLPVSQVFQVFGRAAHADDSVDDVETDVDAVMSDSVAAQAEAADAKARARKAKLAEAKMRAQAQKKEREARLKAVAAKRKIQIYNEQTRLAIAQQNVYAKKVAVARKKIAEIEAALAKTRTRLRIAEADLAAAKNEQNTLNQSVSRDTNEQKSLEYRIRQDRTQTTLLSKNISALRLRKKQLDRRIVYLKEQALRSRQAKRQANAGLEGTR